MYDTIFTPLCALSAQRSRVEIPTQSMVMEGDEELNRIVASKTRLST